MKVIKLFFMFIFISLSVQAEQSVKDCSKECKSTLIDAEFEFSYHSGASSTAIVEMIQGSCKQEINSNCVLGDSSKNGSMVYLMYASCIFVETKQDCENRYEKNRD